jgi:hypothetical protein
LIRPTCFIKVCVSMAMARESFRTKIGHGTGIVARILSMTVSLVTSSASAS